MTKPEDMWLIYSHERKGWWRPGRRGYTLSMAEAGRYTEQEAMRICQQANVFVPNVVMPNEVMVPAPADDPVREFLDRNARYAGELGD